MQATDMLPAPMVEMLRSTPSLSLTLESLQDRLAQLTTARARVSIRAWVRRERTRDEPRMGAGSGGDSFSLQPLERPTASMSVVHTCWRDSPGWWR